MTKKYSRLLILASLGFIFILHNEQTFAGSCSNEKNNCISFLKTYKLTRVTFCSRFGRTESFDIAALVCEAAWGAPPEKLCELVAKARVMPQGCP